MKQNDLYYKELSESLEKRELTLFIGSGLSIGSGLPGWYQLISELAKRIDYELPPAKWITGDALIDAAQAYINERSLNNLVRFLRSELDTTHRQPTKVHEAIARLPISLVFTANYDDLLERAFRDAGKRVNLVVEDDDITLMSNSSNEVNIIKMYGDLDRPNTIVLARQQYEQFFLKRPQIVKLLETELGRSAMLYLGWSHTDPHFNLLFGETLNRFGSLMRSGYAVTFDFPETKRRELERKQIDVIQLANVDDKNSELAAWLNNLLPIKPTQQSVKVNTQEDDLQEESTPRHNQSSIDTQTIRELLIAAFNDEELTTFCFDNFRTVYEDFTTGMSKNSKIQQLLDYCDRQGKSYKLLELVKVANPHQYNKFINN